MTTIFPRHEAGTAAATSDRTWAEFFKELHGLLFQAGIMEIEEAFHLVGVEVALPVLFEEADRPIERVDHDLGRLAALGVFERRIEATHEVHSVLHATGVQHEVEARRADQIEPRCIMTSSEHSTDGNVAELLLTKSIQQDFRRPGSS